MFVCMNDGSISVTDEIIKDCKNCKNCICKFCNDQIRAQTKLSEVMRDSMHALAGYYEEFEQ